MSSERPIFPTLARGFGDFRGANEDVYPTCVIAIRACHDLYLLGIGCVTTAGNPHLCPRMFLRFLSNEIDIPRSCRAQQYADHVLLLTRALISESIIQTSFASTLN